MPLDRGVCVCVFVCVCVCVYVCVYCGYTHALQACYEDDYTITYMYVIHFCLVVQLTYG